MKLGTETGSLVNHVIAKSDAVPEIGMACTILHWTDRTPGTVIEISKSGKTIKVQEDASAVMFRNVAGQLVWGITRDPNGYVWTFRLTKSGWKSSGNGLRLGFAERYYDENF
jgi:hypothetical protein